MQINHIFNEKIENNIWTLSFKEFSWILPVKVRYNEVLCNELFCLFQLIFTPSSNLLTDAMMSLEKSRLLTAVIFDRMIREGVILPAHSYEFSNMDNSVQLSGIYLSPNKGLPSVLVKTIHFYQRHCIGIHLRNQGDFDLNGFELIVQVHEDCLASINCIRRLIIFLNKIHKEYL